MVRQVTDDGPGIPQAILAPRSNHRGTRVLVIEDEPTVGRLIADVLEDEGLHVDVLLDGREALDRAGRERCDLVICDMKMPGLDGQNFYQSLARAESASGAFPFCDRRRDWPANPGIFGAKPAASRGQAVPRREAGGEGI